VVKVEVVSEDMGIRENGAKAWVVLKYSPTCPKTRLQRKHL
jgi:hypothetical protein